DEWERRRSAVSQIGSDAHDRAPDGLGVRRAIVDQPDPFSDNRQSRKGAICEVLADDHRLASRFAVGRVEVPSDRQRYTDRLEVARPDRGGKDAFALLAGTQA